MPKKILDMRHITKAFAGVTVLSDVSFDLYEGEVHALIGENGAGKSTLIKILTGVYTKDSGVIEKLGPDGKMIQLENISPKRAQELGISIVFQECNLLNNLSVAENIFIGREPRTSIGTVDWKKLREDTKEILKRVKLDISPDTLVANLSTAEKQSVEIAKSLSYKADFIVLDEPTSSLTEREVEVLFELINDLKSKSTSIIYISHRIEEIFKITDRITVLRDGKYVGTFITSETNNSTLVQCMIGRKLSLEKNTQYRDCKDRPVALEVRSVNVNVSTRSRPFDFQLHKGEILGFFGLVGAGRTELARIIFGVDKNKDAAIYKDGKRITINSPLDAINSGIALIPEDRKELGLILSLSVQNNLVLTALKNMNWFRKNRQEEKELTLKYIRDLSVALSSEDQPIEELSGGNQQKVVLGKWLALKPDILIMDEPTRGIDVGAKAEIYAIMRKLADEGTSILMISSEMPEILHISDRVIVLYEGQKTLDEAVVNLDQEKLMYVAIGGN
jgi:ribose transport system ATP-binding protein